MPAHAPFIRPAVPGDAPILTRIAIASKAIWGYDDAFMASCRDELTVTQADIQNQIVRLLEADEKPVAFFHLIVDQGGADCEVEAFFVDPEHIGKGYGKLLWGNIEVEARRAGVETIFVQSDPNAEAFYLNMGMTRIGEQESFSIPGRQLPLLQKHI